MKTKIQIKSIFGELLFECEKENNSIKDTLIKAVKENVHLYNADLRNVHLYNADLRNANLHNADLRNANLENADLYNANLENANLRNADLRNANLYNANLENADLYNANLENANLRNANLYKAYLYNANLENANLENATMPIFCKWPFGVINDKIKIGCKTKTIEEWDLFFNSNEEYSTKRGAVEFKQIQAVYEALKAYTNFLKEN